MHLQVDGWHGWGYNGPMDLDLSGRLRFIRSLPIFSGLDPNSHVLRLLADECRECQFEAGEVIFHQGDPGSTCHVVVEGRVRVLVISEDGSELAVRILGAGELMGEMALFEERPRSASVEALERTKTLMWHREALLHCLRESPALALGLLRFMSARLRYATEGAEELASLTVTERLLRRLERLAQWSGVPVTGGVRIVPPMTQQELAALVGTSRESINRSLVRLRNQGKVRWDRGWIVLVADENEE